MARLAFLFPSARRSEPRVGIPAGTFAEAKTKSDVAEGPRASEPSFESLGWENEDSDVFRLTLPPAAVSAELPNDAFPNITAALLAATERAERGPSQPELPPVADPHRRSKV